MDWLNSDVMYIDIDHALVCPITFHAMYSKLIID